MGTKNKPGPYDCYANAKPDEPMFVLLGRDKHAPTLVWLWATLRELGGEDAGKVKEARECAIDMLDYQVASGRETVGLVQAGFAAMTELIRSANNDAMRLVLSQTKWPDMAGDDMLTEKDK